MLHLADLARVLRALTPRVEVVAGCHLLALGDEPAPAAEQVAAALAHAGGDRRRVERELNRRFLVADVLDAFGLGDAARDDPPTLLVIADALAALVRDRARLDFPDAGLEVEVVGRDLADLEPLEVCVTLARSRP